MCYAIEVHSIIHRFTSFFYPFIVTSSDVAGQNEQSAPFFPSENSIKSSVPWFAYRAPLRLLLAMDARVFPPILSFSPHFLILTFPHFPEQSHRGQVSHLHPSHTKFRRTFQYIHHLFPINIIIILPSKIDCTTSAAREILKKNSPLFQKGEHRLCLIWKVNRYLAATI